MKNPVFPSLFLAAIVGALGLAAFPGWTEGLDMYDEAQRVAEAGNSAQAVQILRGIVEKTPEDWEAWNSLGHMLLRDERPEEAARAFRSGLERDGEQPDLHNNLALAHLASNRPGEAVASLQKALELAPRHADAWFNLGGILQAAGEFEEAIQAYDRALDANPERSDVLHKRAAAKWGAGDIPGALRDYRSLLEREPENDTARADLGFALLQTGKPAEAEPLFRKVTGRHPDWSRAWFGLGQSLRGRLPAEQVVSAFQKAVELDPDNPDFRFHLGMAHLSRRSEAGMEEAASVFSNLARTFPEHGQGRYMWGMLLKENEQVAEALPHLRAALNSGGPPGATRMNLAETLVTLERGEEARPLLQEMMDHLPKEDPLRQQAVALMNSLEKE